MDWKLELVVVPVADVDRAKEFYVGKVGFDVLVDHSAGEDFRVVQLVPPGSACAIALMRNESAGGTLQGLHPSSRTSRRLGPIWSMPEWSAASCSTS